MDTLPSDQLKLYQVQGLRHVDWLEMEIVHVYPAQDGAVQPYCIYVYMCTVPSSGSVVREEGQP